jgi:tetratricopeptide (TPR) repeat protein
MTCKQLSSVLILFVLSMSASAQTGAQSDVLPLSTNSAKVRKMMEQVWVLNSDQVEQEKACVVLRKIVRIDPKFAVGHELLAQFSLDPAEQVLEQHRAVATRMYATPGEQTLIDWFQSAANHQLIPAITSMNQMLKDYPHDKWVVMLANYWLTTQTQYDRAAVVFEHSGLTNSPGLVNNAAYTYAFLRQFDKAFALMDKYVSLLPKDPNPQDSYAEILRMAGHYNQAIEHYHAALTINPSFYSSQFGIADTYMLKGDEPRAREEYESAFHKFRIPALHTVQWKNREAMTYIREGDLAGADRAFEALADFARRHKMGQVEADTYRQMAIYQPDPQKALEYLKKAESIIHEGENTMAIAVQQELAQIERARVEEELKAGYDQAAETTLQQLAAVADGSDDKLIETAYHGAAGASLFAHRKYKEAITHLEEDTDNPLSLRLLGLAYRHAGDLQSAKHVSEVLASTSTPILEQALVVPGFRDCLQKPNCDAGMRNASLQ